MLVLALFAVALYASLERFDWDQFKAAMTWRDRGRVTVSCCPRSARHHDRGHLVFIDPRRVPAHLSAQRGVMIGNLIVNFFTGAQPRHGGAAALIAAGRRPAGRVPAVVEVEDAYRA